MLKRILAAASLVMALLPASGNAMVVDSNTVIRANFSAIAPFDDYLIQLLFGGPSGSYPDAGEGLRFSLYNSSDELVHQATFTQPPSIYTSWRPVDRLGLALTPEFYIVLDKIVGEFDLQRIEFFPWLNSISYFDFPSTRNSNPQDFIVTAAEVPEPQSIALLGFGLLGVIVFRRRKQA